MKPKVMVFKIILMAKIQSKLQWWARPQREWTAGSTVPSRHRAAELLPEMENVLCPIASIPLFRFQAVTIAEATISSISHLAYSKLEWVGFSLAYKWATGSRMSSRWDYGLDMRKDLRVWPWNKVQGFLLGSYTVQRENWVHQNVMQISWQCLGSAMHLGPSVHACSRTQISPWESALSLTRAGQGLLCYFKTQSCPCPRGKIIHVSRRNLISYFIHPSLPQWLKTVTQWTRAISEQGWGTPFPFTEDVFLWDSISGPGWKENMGKGDKHRHQREPVSVPLAEEMPMHIQPPLWNRRREAPTWAQHSTLGKCFHYKLLDRG